MPANKAISALHAQFQPLVHQWLDAVQKRGITLLITETRRSWEVMEAYYARGREPLSVVNSLYTKAGLRPISLKENKSTITKAPPGLSWHFFGLAVDFVPLINGKADWIYDPENPADFYDEVAEEAKALGMDWGGSWRTFKDLPHVEWHPGWTSVRKALEWAQTNIPTDSLKTWQGDIPIG